MTINEIRIDNARSLAKTLGSNSAFGQRLGMDNSQVSQLIGKNPKKNIGDSIARRIEEAFGKARGWMDVGHGTTLEISTYEKNDESEDVAILQYHETGGAMGTGVILRDQPGEIHSWHVSPEWIAKNVRSHTGAANLCIVTGFGDSMQPLYNPGDPLLVDRGVTSAEHDGIYFFRIGNEGFIKRLQRIPGIGLMAISDNKLYEKWVITQDMDFEVFAKIVKVWCGSDR